MDSVSLLTTMTTEKMSQKTTEIKLKFMLQPKSKWVIRSKLQVYSITESLVQCVAYMNAFRGINTKIISHNYFDPMNWFKCVVRKLQQKLTRPTRQGFMYFNTDQY